MCWRVNWECNKMNMINRIAEVLTNNGIVEDKKAIAVSIIEAIIEATPEMIDAGEKSMACGFSAKYVWSDMVRKGLE